MAFLGTLFSIILGFYILGFFARIFLRFWIRKKVKDFEQGKTSGGFYRAWTNTQGWKAQNPNQNQSSQHEGDVTITSDGNRNRNIDKNIGEYVEFDEIKENK